MNDTITLLDGQNLLDGNTKVTTIHSSDKFHLSSATYDGNGKVLTLGISRVLDGDIVRVFHGSLEDAAESGWTITRTDSDAATIADLLEQQKDAERRLTAAQYELRAADDRYTAYMQKVRDAVVEAQATHDFCLEGTNDFLRELELEPIENVTGWTVTIEDKNGHVLGEVEVQRGDADDDSEAIEYVKTRIEAEVTAAEATVSYTFYGSDGVEDSGESEDDSTDLVDDNWLEAEIECLSFSTEEITS